MEPRNLIELVNDYLKIIPDIPETQKYREQLRIEKNNLEKRLDYASPEEIALYWKYINKILLTFNTHFVELDYPWAKAILSICRYEYHHESVKPYLNQISHYYTKKLTSHETT